MCEPTHSIVQFPDDQPKPPAGPGPVQPTGNLDRKSFGSSIIDWIKRVGSWFHLTEVGSGHSQAIAWLNGMAHTIPPENRYEAYWWCRSVKLDGPYRGALELKDNSLECASTYANAVSIGNLTALRRFLGASLRKSRYPIDYCCRMLDCMIVPSQRDAVAVKSVGVIGTNIILGRRHYVNDMIVEKIDQVVKFILGLTRKRHLLVPEWADDTTLWNPAS